MTETRVPEITKAVVDRFLAGKHVTGCSICGRRRSRIDIDLHTIRCERAPSTAAVRDVMIDVVAIVCENCGATQFLKRSVITDWLERQRILWAKAACEDGRKATASRLLTHQLCDRTVAVLTSVFVFVLIASLFLHRYGGVEPGLGQAIATAETQSRGATKIPSPVMHDLAFER